MADVRCPMCGKLNQADAKTCRFCQARLVPVTQGDAEKPDWMPGASGGGSSSGTPPANKADEQSPEWLARIRQRKEDEDAVSRLGPSPKVPSQGDEGVDWLNNLRGKEASATPADADWLNSFRSPDQGPEQAPGSNAQEETSSAPDDSGSDWLGNLRGAATPETQEPEIGLPTWLGSQDESPAPSTGDSDRLHQIAAAEQGYPPSQEPAKPSAKITPAAPSGESPDWLNEFETPPTYTAESLDTSGWKTDFEDSAGQTSEETPDWLKGIDSGSGSSSQPTPLDDTPDWMKQIDPGAASQRPPEDDNQDWLKAFESGLADQTVPSTPSSVDETPDWLQSFGTQQPPAQAETPAATPMDETPDWLQSFGAQQPPAQAETPAAVPMDETPDWLQSFGAQQPPAQAETPAAVPMNETPDWLQSFGAQQPPAQAETPTAAPMDETPDWLQSFGAQQPPAQAETPAAAPMEETPDWLQSFGAQPGAESAPPSETPSVESSSKPAVIPGITTGWLRGLGSEPVQPPSPSAESETPSWLQEFETAGSEEPAQAEPAAAPAEVPGWLSGEDLPLPAANANALPAEDIPDWLRSAQVSGGTETGGAAISPFAMPGFENFQSAEVPTLSQGGGTQAFTTEEYAEAHPATPAAQPVETPPEEPLGAVPDWLSAIPAGKPESESPPAQRMTTPAAVGPVENEESIEMAQLPSWLQAMKPVEAVTSGLVQVDDQRLEKSGPLAGLRGILPGEDVVSHYRKPPTYSSKLRLTDKQRTNIALLEEALAVEGVPQEIKTTRETAPQILLRLVLGAVLIVTIIAVLLLGGQPPVEKNIPLPLQAFFAQVERPEIKGMPVLLAVEYEARLTDEMENASLPAVAHLMVNQAALRVVSTNPVGPLLGQQLLEKAVKALPSGSTYDLNQARNLGYLAGGTFSMHSLDLSSYRMVVVLTDNVDTGRAWIEQVQPQLKGVPFLLVSSDQSAPMLAPYFGSQVQGMVTGLTGGTAYTQQLGGQVQGLGNWLNARQMGMLLAAVVILVGSVFSLLSGSVTGRKRKKA